ncbi:MAG TPA: TfoX/Sxy family protein [Chitinophagales bacterium]|nr:TfoX/Sxy family protein [Chitinophagales bacterium]HNE45616.1 TfoX/Sxy family protein [Chitinophagales bacterium]HNF70653.1 TfoX/Sxy family protein [Chitinophagales bacterium]HNI55907.1 TfoX/Sxy family protein [Chitinophagales bacterium]HNM08021.1 TfoX/Sxy family protein [Chitinophagales bacterium]
MAYDTQLADRIYEILLAKEIPFTEKKMFGGIAYMVNDAMACGIIKNDLMIRCFHEDHEKLLKMQHVGEMKFTGKSMRGFLMIYPSGFETDAALGYWLQHGVNYALLAPKKPKKSKKK